MRLPFRHADSGHINDDVFILVEVLNVVKERLGAIDTEHLSLSAEVRHLRLTCYANSFRSTSRTYRLV